MLRNSLIIGAAILIAGGIWAAVAQTPQAINTVSAKLWCYTPSGGLEDWKPCGSGSGGGGGIPTTTVPSGVTTTMATAAPTATTFSSLLAASATRKGCSIQNVGTTLGYVYFGVNGSATTSNSFQVPANGGFISCNNVNGTVLQDNLSATCASGICAFIIASQ